MTHLPAIVAQGGYGPPGGGAPPGGYGPPGGGYPPPGGYGPPGGGYPPPGGYGGYPPPGYNPAPLPIPPQPPGPGADLKRQATTWLVIAVVTFFFCGGINCLGVVGAILCFLAMQAADQGNLSDAESKLKWGKIVVVAGAALSFITVASALLYYFIVQAEAFAVH